MMQGWINNAPYKRLNGRKAIGFGEGRGPTWPFGTHQVQVVFRMLGYAMLVPTTPAPRAAHVGKWACKGRPIPREKSRVVTFVRFLSC
jgi:hypothetical protein